MLKDRRPTDEEFLDAMDHTTYPANPRIVVDILKDMKFGEDKIRAQMWSMIERRIIKPTNDLNLIKV